ncbi:hypothetical protein ABMA70_08370 [Halobacteriovorax sp. XZX-3]|uniref:hypothetical protein n=2 Tax=unclassified Halobacteriovorax TaxID=2639665 RepID=UPI000CD0D557|nr:hypothetical protein [Halobacteriovorax sp. DA5]POB12426.1 hypothetical protein C0Z22_15525 [Halobacteriovorax sp. DA5]
MKKHTTNISLEPSLQAYFYDELHRINLRRQNPLPQLSIFYSSLVMDKFGLSQHYFEEQKDGRLREKTLGLKLLQAEHLNEREKKRELRDIADTALFLCGYFSNSVNEKIIDLGYYCEVGKTAYQKLDHYQHTFYDSSGFFKNLASQFYDIINLMSLLQSDCNLNEEQYLLFTKDVS